MRSRSLGVLVTLVALVTALEGCGYHLLHEDDAASLVAVVGGRSTAAAAALQAEAEAGARAELARDHALGGPSDVRGPGARGASRALTIEVVRVDEEAEGIRRGAGPSPLASAVRITVTGRARLTETSTGALLRETPSLTASEIAARLPSVAAGQVTFDEAGRVAARRLGEQLVRAALGRPDPQDP